MIHENDRAGRKTKVIAGLGSDLPPSAFADPSEIFADGFELGDTGGWSQTIQ